MTRHKQKSVWVFYDSYWDKNLGIRKEKYWVSEQKRPWIAAMQEMPVNPRMQNEQLINILSRSHTGNSAHVLVKESSIYQSGIKLCNPTPTLPLVQS